MTSKRHLAFAARAIVTVGIVGWLVSKIAWTDLIAHLRGVDVLVLAPCIVLPALPLTLMALRWKAILARLGFSSRFRDVLALLLRGQTFNSFLPGSTGGDIYKVAALCRRHPETKVRVAVSVVIDRLVATVALLLLAIPSLRILLDALPPEAIRRLFWLPVPVLVIALAIVLYIKNRTRQSAVESRIRQAWTEIVPYVKESVGLLTALVILSLAIHSVYFFTAFTIMRALEFPVTLGQCMAFMPIVMISSLLPISINGHGVREAILTMLFASSAGFAAAGLRAPEAALAFSALYVGLDFLWCIPGGVLLLVGSGTNQPHAS